MNKCMTEKLLFLFYSLIGGKVLNDRVSLYGNAVKFNRNFGDSCIVRAVIASFWVELEVIVYTIYGALIPYRWGNQIKWNQNFGF